ncbi:MULTISPECIES: FAD-binding oxidoreductase [unclassified Synechococcus]|uniref:NAD(P)/FAD-dependent oxidoreductase n=1 Tax=unclassified Synechococcus TaxID=2626047 RepID=UPI0000698347|nr:MULTISPECIES: FAD-dependent oxidoreductase [unclassified Synechococcus]EAQ75701.1 NAD binding site:D-amino acid oxidase [Synechococcus sp. WH 5701]WFN59627.1 FAD-dependent oxidoreductase [Synechococcus sp. CCFWC 502]
MVVIGGGIVALATAWLLQCRGHRVRLIAPDADGPHPQESRSGSAAALGVLMAQVFQRSRGRAWRLRQTSLSLWTQWRQELSGRGCPIPFQAGLLLLARDTGDTERLRQLLEERQALGLPLSWWEPSRLQDLGLGDAESSLGGLHSAQDGQLDPLAAMDAFRRDGLQQGLELVSDLVVGLERQPTGWRVHGLSAAQAMEAEWVVVAAGLASEGLLAPLGHQRPHQPVLGQCLELATSVPIRWPCPVVWQGLNLVPRPGGGLWLGATLEPGDHADPQLLEPMRQLAGEAPGCGWLREAEVIRRLQGLRARPIGRPAPLLEHLEPGLLLLCGHYRNGVLLAPASAQWAVEQIESSLTCR